jgi:hypothetical protein
MQPASIYCDRLTLASCLCVVRLRRALVSPAPRTVHVLDPLPTGPRAALLCGFLALFDLGVEEAPFFAGRLEMTDGRVAQVAAARAAMDAALAEAQRLVSASEWLERLDRAWGRHTVRLHLAKACALGFGGRRSLYASALRVHVTRALASPTGRVAYLCVEEPILFSSACLQDMASDVRLVFYGRARSLVSTKALVCRQWIRAWIRSLRSIWRRAFARGRVPDLEAAARGRPGLLLVQEADIGLDRSYRLQPHWLLPGDPQTAYETYILAQTPPPRAPHDDEALGARHVHVLTPAEVESLARPVGSDDFVRRLRRDAAASLRAAWRSSSPSETAGSAFAARLLYTASELTMLCRRLRVKTFMTAENYLLQSDAIQIAARGTDVRTVSYQYSNLAAISPVMLTTADVMLTFSPNYHRYWSATGVGPGAFVDVGHCMDSSFPLVRERARVCRSRLHAAGANFVLAYYDETVQDDKYGLMTARDHCDELRRLLELLLADSSVGVVVKVQYQRHSPSRFSELAPLVEAASRTGRFVEMLHGVHRNIILPAEAAMCADMAIGHAVGGTAPLEAAMTGTRTLILNPYRFVDGNHAIYRRANVLFGSLPEALASIAAFRAGDLPDLGDWTPMIDVFDPYRDGLAGRRVRAVLDYLTTETGGTAGGSDLQAVVDRVTTAGRPMADAPVV